MKSADHPAPDEDSVNRHLYSGIELKSVLEELEEVYSKRTRGLRIADDESVEERMALAYDIAKEHLKKLLAVGEGGETPQGEAEPSSVEN